MMSEIERKRSASVSGIFQGAPGPAKKQLVEGVVVDSTAKKVDKEAKKVAQRLAQDKANCIAKEVKPEGWPSRLSVAAISTTGVSFYNPRPAQSRFLAFSDSIERMLLTT